jgi:pimeloyl-ACP methyl ester carboxylesterase
LTPPGGTAAHGGTLAAEIVFARNRAVCPYARRVATFGLVHGSWHGAWCWEFLTPLLREAGHDVVAVDLPREDSSASFETYADIVCDALKECGDDMVLVGHSMAGTTVSLVAARRQVRHLVYLCAVIPDIGRSIFDQIRDEPVLNPAYVKGLSEPDSQNRTRWVDLKLAREVLFADCDETLSETATNRLGLQARYPYSLRFPLAEFPSVPCTYIVCSDDQLVSPDWSKQVARDRLGADITELPGSHSPFLSRPSALADVLLDIAADS